MKHRMFLAAVFGAAAWLVATPDLGLAFGKKRGDDCAPPCPTPCAPAYTVQWVEKDVTVLEPVFKTKDVEVTVMKPVPVTKDVTCKVAVPKSKIEKREVVTMTRVAVKKPYEYWVNELVATKEKRTVVECVPSTKEVEVDVTTYATVAKEVEQVVAVCKKVPVACDPCAPCAPVCEPTCGGKKGLFGKKHSSCGVPCGPQFTTVVEHVKTKCIVHECVPTTKKVKQQVTTYANVSKEVTVDVWKCVPTKKVSEYTCWECVPVKSTVDVTVHYCEYVDKTEKVTYYECQPVKQTVKHSYCEMVSVTKKVKVPVHVPCAAPAPVVAPCAPACTPVCAVVPTCEKEKHKLFGRKSCGGCN